MRRILIPAVVFAALVSAAAPARAEIVFFTSGRTLNIKGHREDGQALVLTMRGGGEMVCDASVVEKFAPDEVPYPEAEAEKAPVPRLGRIASTGRTASRRPAYGEIIDRVSAEQGVPAKLVRAVIQVESAYQERARSKKGAMGLMQLMPQTARQYAVANPYDPASNIEAGIKHLKALLQKLPTALALAAYNAGEATVERFHGIPPYPETQAYVSRILQLVRRS